MKKKLKGALVLIMVPLIIFGGCSKENPDSEQDASPPSESQEPKSADDSQPQEQSEQDQEQPQQKQQTPPQSQNQQAPKQPAQSAQPKQVGYCETKLMDAGRPRITNLKLAMRKINGKVIAPGAEFSFNRFVGRRTATKGYKEATIYRNNKEVKEVGGGICQLSSTLYSAALDAGMTITERHEHQLPVDYIQQGRDATVYYGRLDFRFVNSLDVPVKISCSIKNRKVIVALTTAVQ